MRGPTRTRLRAAVLGAAAAVMATTGVSTAAAAPGGVPGPPVGGNDGKGGPPQHVVDKKLDMFHIDVQLLNINDFHGHLEPPSGSSGRIVVDEAGTTVDAGGAEYLATHIKQLQAETDAEHSIFLSSGDNIGGTPFLSAIFRDEPTVEFLNSLGLFASSTGNHEYDRGIEELLRIQHGGCHPEGCFTEDGFEGADWTYLSANVTRESDGSLVMPAYAVKNLERGVKMGFIGVPLEETPTIVTAAGVAGLEFGDEVEAVNRAVTELQKRRVEAIVLLLHQGDRVEFPATPQDCNDAAGPARTIAEQVDAEVDVVFAGHSHQQYVCTVLDPAGQERPILQGASFGRLVSEVELTIDRRSRDVIRDSITTENHIVTRDVARDPATTQLIQRYTELSAPLANRVVGTVAEDLTRTQDAAGESTLGNVIADAQLAATSAPELGGADVAFMNPGGIRTDLLAGEATYAEIFAVQPFGNYLVTMTLTGAQIDELLEQQFDNPQTGAARILQVSEGFGYTWDASAPVGSRVDIGDITIDGEPIDPDAAYRVTVNSFLADGGDNFTVLRDGTDRVVGVIDLDAFEAYLAANSPVAAPAQDRIDVVNQP